MPIPSDSLPSENNQDPTDSFQEELFVSPPEELAQEEVIEPSPPMPETPLPPETWGEPSGGPLGCCLGTVVGLLLTLLIMLTTSILLSNGGYLGPATLPVPLLGAVICGFLGWQIGKRVYRDYELHPKRKQRLESLEQKWRSRHS